MTETLERISPALSDLYFNHDFSGCRAGKRDEDAPFGFDMERLREETENFRFSVEQLTGHAPPAEALIADMFARI